MKPLTPDAAGRELARVLVAIRKERDKLTEHTKTVKGRIAAMEERASDLAAIANGEAAQVELDTTSATLAEARAAVAARELTPVQLEEPAAAPAEPMYRQEPPTRKRKRKAKGGDEHHQDVELPGWLRRLIGQKGAPAFVPGEWWPELDPVTLLPAHGPAGTACPKTGGDWRDCATCAAEVSREKADGEEVQRA